MGVRRQPAQTCPQGRPSPSHQPLSRLGPGRYLLEQLNVLVVGVAPIDQGDDLPVEEGIQWVLQDLGVELFVGVRIADGEARARVDVDVV